MAAVSGNWVSTTTTASLLTSQPIVPPRPEKYPTLPRMSAKRVAGGAVGV
jgi:hypothetical protein